MMFCMSCVQLPLAVRQNQTKKNPGGYNDITKYLKFTNDQTVLAVKKFNQFKSRLRFHTQHILSILKILKKFSTYLYVSS